MVNEEVKKLIETLKETKKCDCGALLKLNYNYCPNCGAFLVKDASKIIIRYAYICPICKTELDKYYGTYCHNCGHRLKR